MLLLLSLILLWTAFTLQTNLLEYLLNRPFVIRIVSYSPIIAISGILVWILESYQTDFDNTDSQVVKIVIPIMLYLITRYAIFYNVVTDSFKSLSAVSHDYNKFISENPELVVVHINLASELEDVGILPEKAHVVPLRNLVAGDMRLSINEKRGYSLTYCLLCNSIHAYLLPIIEGKQVNISSNQGSVLNGNKILTDKRGRYVWQQFTGKLVHNSTDSQVQDLVEIRLTRMIWDHAQQTYKDALFYHKKVNLSVYFVFRNVGKLVKKFENIAFSRGGKNKTLEKKIPIIGVNIVGEGQKAYPYESFEPNKMTIFEDRIGNTEFTFVFNGFGAYVYKITGLQLEGGQLIQGEMQWTLNGHSTTGHDNLLPIQITEHAYWYLWNKFYPNTEIYTTN